MSNSSNSFGIFVDMTTGTAFSNVSLDVGGKKKVRDRRNFKRSHFFLSEISLTGWRDKVNMIHIIHGMRVRLIEMTLLGKVKSYLSPGKFFTLWLAQQNRQIMKGFVIFNHSSMLPKKEQPLFPKLYRIR